MHWYLWFKTTNSHCIAPFMILRQFLAFFICFNFNCDFLMFTFLWVFKTVRMIAHQPFIRFRSDFHRCSNEIYNTSWTSNIIKTYIFLDYANFLIMHRWSKNSKFNLAFHYFSLIELCLFRGSANIVYYWWASAKFWAKSDKRLACYHPHSFVA